MSDTRTTPTVEESKDMVEFLTDQFVALGNDFAHCTTFIAKRAILTEMVAVAHDLLLEMPEVAWPD